MLACWASPVGRPTHMAGILEHLVLSAYGVSSSLRSRKSDSPDASSSRFRA